MTDISDLKAWRDVYLRAHAEIVRQTAIKDQAKEILRGRLDETEDEVGTIDGAPAVRLLFTSGRFDSKAFAKDRPDLYQQYRGEASRRFEVVPDE